MFNVQATGTGIGTGLLVGTGTGTGVGITTGIGGNTLQTALLKYTLKHSTVSGTGTL